MLTIDAVIPVAVLPDGDARADVAPESALQVLRALNMLALGARADAGETPGTETSHDFARLEAKIDMLLALVGSLVTGHMTLPPARRVQFSAESVVVSVDERRKTGDPVVVALYLSHEIPQPLYLPAAVDSVNPSSNGTHFEVRLEFAPLNAAIRDELERYIFLRHRRELSRKPSG